MNGRLIGGVAAAWLLSGGMMLAAPIDDMAARIEADLNGRCVGYGYAIFQNGSFMAGGGGGAAKLGDPDNIFDPGTPFDEDTVKDCHSMSKTITAAAMMRALAQSGNPVTSAVLPFFPANIQGVANDPNFPAIQFDDLLAHRSGMSASSSYSWSAIRTQASGGLPNSIGTYEYANWNYASCRLLIPYLVNGNFFRNMEQFQAGDPSLLAILDSATANFYINYVNDQVFERAGLGAIYPRPVDSTLDQFGWYYNASDLSIAGQLMADRRLTVGSGGWAISARDYAQFIDALFDNKIVNSGQLTTLQNGELGMFDRTGSNGSDVYWSHNGATTGNGVGGRSVWMYFPNDISVAVQVNSAFNPYEGPGIGLDTIVQEAWEKEFSTDPASLVYPMHLFMHRAVDGWLTSRGIRSSGWLGARNFDYDDDVEAPVGFTHHRFLRVADKAYLFRYKADGGRAVMHPVNADGTIGNEIFDTQGWLSGWTHIEPFMTPSGTFLLLHNSGNGLIRTVPVSALGNVGSAITDANYTTGFDVVKILVLSGTSHLFRHNSGTGETHLRVLNSDGSIGATAYSGTWSTSFRLFEFYTAGGDTYLFRYHPDTGAARINRIDGSLDNTPEVLDQDWSTGWQIVKFFEMGNQAMFFRYNPQTGDVRMQQITNGGVPASNTVWSSGNWLRETVGTGPFNPSRSGWTEIEIYDATPGISSPGLNLDGYDDLPLVVEIGSVIDPVARVPENIGVVVPAAEPPQVHTIRGIPYVEWEGKSGLTYFIEHTVDLQRWEVLSPIEGDGSGIALQIERDPTDGSLPEQSFYRVRSYETIPPLDEPIGGPQ